MRFLNPSGLWLLLGVPVLIAFYLIRSKHDDRPVSSTFIWKLSSRFMKKRLPMQRIRKILTFILQLVIIITVALLAARPAIVLEKSCDYIAIIDASASMQTVDSAGKSRFQYALDEVETLSGKVEKGHTVSVILASDAPSWLVKKSSSQKEITLAMEQAACTYSSCNTEEALSLAQELCVTSANPQILFYTDNSYDLTENIQVIDLNKQEWNVSVSNVTAENASLGIAFTGQLVSHHQDALVTVGLRIDGIFTDVQKVRCQKDVPVTVTCTAEEVTAYDTAEIFVEAEDGLQADNSFAICRSRQRTYNVTLVSQSPLYLESALNALGNCKVTVAASTEGATLTGQDLYIFDGIAPKSYPKDGSVLIFNPQSLPEGLQFGEKVTSETLLTVASDSTGAVYDGLSLKEAVISTYTPLRGNLLWQDLFFCDSQPVIVTKDAGNGLQHTVVSFDLHDSSLPMQTDFLVLMKNLVELSIPAFLRDRDHIAGSTVNLTVLTKAEQLYVTYPDGTISALPTTSAVAGITADQVGIYTATMSAEGRSDYADFFVHVAQDETVGNRYPELSVELALAPNTVPEDAINELWFWLALGLLLLVLTEWGWYYREQY